MGLGYIKVSMDGTQDYKGWEVIWMGNRKNWDEKQVKPFINR